MGKAVVSIVSARKNGRWGMVVSITGKMNIETVPDFEKEISSYLTENAGIVFMDLSSVAYIDSSGTGVLIRLNNMAKVAGTRIILYNLAAPVRNIFERSYLDRFFTIQTADNLRETYPGMPF